MKMAISMEQACEDNGWLGRVVAVHSIGEYDIVEYWHNPAPNNKDQNTYLAFATYIDGKKTNRSYDSLDEALAGCIARKYDGLNTRADIYFIRGIRADFPALKMGGAPSSAKTEEAL